MIKVTFKEFCTKEGFGPGIHQNNFCTLAAIIGVHNSYLSRLYNDQETTEKRGEAFEAVKYYMASKGYELIYKPTSSTAKIMKKPTQEKSVFDKLLQKEYNKLLNKCNNYEAELKELRKQKDVTVEYQLLQTKYNQLQQDYKILKHHIDNLKSLFDLLNLMGE